MLNDSERDDLVMTLVERARLLPSDQRTPFLRSACAGDQRLFEETSDYVRREEEMGDFLLEPVTSFLEPDPEFKPGQVLAGRFEIVRLVGQGGMAYVYEAIDKLRDQRVAIKCAKPDFTGRLLPETETSLRVAHENVCRVHEIHRAAKGEGADEEEVDFITMEF